MGSSASVPLGDQIRLFSKLVGNTIRDPDVGGKSDLFLRTEKPTSRVLKSPLIVGTYKIPLSVLFPLANRSLGCGYGLEFLSENRVEAYRNWEGRRATLSRKEFILMLDLEKFQSFTPALKLALRRHFSKHSPTFIYKTDGSFDYEGVTFYYTVPVEMDKKESTFLFESERSIRQVVHIEELELRTRDIFILNEALSRNTDLLKEAKERGELSDVGALYLESERIREAIAEVQAKPNPIREHIDSLKVKLHLGWNIVGGLLVTVDVVSEV